MKLMTLKMDELFAEHCKQGIRYIDARWDQAQLSGQNPGKAFFIQHDKTQQNPGQKNSRRPIQCQQGDLYFARKKKLFTPYLGMTLWEITVSALLDLDTESSTYQA